MKIVANYGMLLNSKVQKKQQVVNFRGFSDQRGLEHFMDDYGRDSTRIIEKLSDAYGKDLIYVKKNPLEYNEDLRGELYIVPQGGRNLNIREASKIEYTYYRTSKEMKQKFLRELVFALITLPNGSKGSVWSGLDEANIRKKKYNNQFNADYLYGLLSAIHTAQTSNGRYLWTGPYNKKKV